MRRSVPAAQRTPWPKVRPPEFRASPWISIENEDGTCWCVVNDNVDAAAMALPDAST